MKKYGVIGYPLTHSLSPPMHNAAFKALSIAAEYKKYQIIPDDFISTMKVFKKEDYAGINVTIPYKRRIIEFLDEIDPDAEAIGAVNTVIKKGHFWKGYNTDIAGFIAPLLNINRPILSCLILGTGGAARAVLFSIGKYLNPDRIMVAGRSPEKAKDLCDQLQPLLKSTSVEYMKINEVGENCEKYDLIVNATPLGTFPDIDNSPLPALKSLKPDAIVYDLVYNPEKTKFLRDAQAASGNAIILNGLEMLIEQAAHSFKIWTGKEMPRDVVRKHLLQAL